MNVKKENIYNLKEYGYFELYLNKITSIAVIFGKTQCQEFIDILKIFDEL